MNRKYIIYIFCILFVSCSHKDKSNDNSASKEITAKPKVEYHFEDGGCEFGVTPHLDTTIVKRGVTAHIKLDVICIKNVNIYDTSVYSGRDNDSEIYVYQQRDSYLNFELTVNGVSKSMKIYKAAFIDSIGASLARNGTFRDQFDLKFNPKDSSLSLGSYIMYTGTDAGAEIYYKINWNGKIEILSAEMADEFDS